MKTIYNLDELTPAQISGKEKIEANLDLRSVTKLPAGFNPIVGGYLDSVTELPAGFNPTVGGYLDLRSVTKLPAGFNPIVGGSLYLHSVTKLPAGFNPTVGGNLYLDSVKELPAGFNPIVGGDLYLFSVTELPAGFNPIVGGSLDLRSITKLPAGFNPIVGGNLYLSSVTELPAGFNPTVGGYLNLHSVTELPAGFNPIVGGYLDLANSRKASENKPKWPIIKNGYILADGILAKLINQKGKVYKIQLIGHNKPSYLVTDGTNFSHGKTLAEAKTDLIYKVTDRKPEQYKQLTLASKLELAEAIACYRCITGACSFGTKRFVETNSITKKEFTIREIINLTKGHFGNDKFAGFFNA